MLNQLSFFDEHDYQLDYEASCSNKVSDITKTSTITKANVLHGTSCKIIKFPGVYIGNSFDSDDPHDDPLNYSRSGNYIGPPPDGYVWASTFKKNGMRKLVARNSYKGEEKKAYPIIQKNQLETMASWLYTHKDKKYLLAFVLGINLGLRANELLSLRKHDLFWKDGTIRYVEDITDTTDHIRVYQKKTRNSKYSKYRNVFLNTACVDILNWYFPHICSRFYTNKDVEDDRISIEINHCRGGSDLVFPSPQKSKKEELSVNMLYKVLEEASKACGLPQNIATHSIRKTFAISMGTTKTIGGIDIDITKVQRILGHSSASSTAHYTDTEQMNQKADYHSCCLDVTGNLF